jgi:hypothetical protein
VATTLRGKTLSRNSKLAIALSSTWVLGVIGFLGAEYLNVLPGQCVFLGEASAPSIYVDGVFLSCNMFSDISSTWWGIAQIQNGQQILELHVFRLLSSALLPVAAIWFIAVASPAMSRWIRA